MVTCPRETIDRRLISGIPAQPPATWCLSGLNKILHPSSTKKHETKMYECLEPILSLIQGSSVRWWKTLNHRNIFPSPLPTHPPYLVIYRLSLDRLGTQGDMAGTPISRHRTLSQQFLVWTNLKHHRHSLTTLKWDTSPARVLKQIITL